MARVSGDCGVTGKGTTWEVWTRGWTEDEDGDVLEFGRWRCEIVTERNAEVSTRRVRWKGPDGAASDECPTRLPWVAWHDGVADGSPYLDADRSLVQMFDTINASIMSETFAVDMNAAASLVRTSDSPSPKSIAIGPGILATIARDETLTSVATGADFAGIRASNSALVGMLALTSRQSPSDFDVQGTSTPSSGIALRIKSEPQAKARLESIARARGMESQLLALMVEVHDFYRGTSIADPGVTYHMDPQDPPDYEPMEEKQRRALDAESAGMIAAGDLRWRHGGDLCPLDHGPVGR